MMGQNNFSDARRSHIKRRMLVICSIVFIAIATIVISLILKMSWPISIGVANIFFLIILRFVDIERATGIKEIEDHWNSIKMSNKSILLTNCSATKSGKDVRVNGCVKDIYPNEIESLTKANFLLKDTKAYMVTLKSEILMAILLAGGILLLSALGDVKLSTFYHLDPNWNPQAQELIYRLKNSLEITIIVAAVLIQLAFLFRTPFVLESRNRTFLIESNSK